METMIPGDTGAFLYFIFILSALIPVEDYPY
jgi:hypothetical protein